MAALRLHIRDYLSLMKINNTKEIIQAGREEKLRPAFGERRYTSNDFPLFRVRGYR